jgi:hypothetical protein
MLMFSNLLDITGFFVSVLINLLLIALICYYFKRKIDNLEYSQSEQAKTLYTILSQQRSIMTSNDKGENGDTSENTIMDGLDLTQLNQSSHSNREDDVVYNSEESSSDSDSDTDIEEGEELEEDDEKSKNNIQTIHIVDAIDTIDTIDAIDTNDANEVIDDGCVKQIDFDNRYENNQEQNTELNKTTVVIQDPEVQGNAEEIVLDSDPLLDDGVFNTMDKENNIQNLDTEYLNENYEKMTVKELKNVLAEKGVHAKSSMNKSDIISILKGATNIELELNVGEM